MASFTNEQFEQLLARLTVPPVPTPQRIITSSNSWTDLPDLDVSRADKVDEWFLAFESRMKARTVEEARWLEKFDECPRVPREVKSRIAGEEGIATYEQLRLLVLKVYGPLDPVGYFRAQMYKVGGTHREEIRSRLQRLLTLHNRAAKDNGRAEFGDSDLIYPFVQAFPPEQSARLQETMAFAYATPDPFDTLYRTAPSGQCTSSEALSPHLTPQAPPLAAVQQEQGKGGKGPFRRTHSGYGPARAEAGCARAFQAR